MTIEFLANNYKKGDPLPPRSDKNILRIYSFQLCPYAERVLLVLEAKGVKYEVINVNLRDKPEWLYDKSPGAKVPAIEFDSDDKILYESLVISDYIDELYPDKRPLNPKDPYQKAKDKLFVDTFGEFSSRFAKVYHSSDELSDIWIGVKEALEKLEAKFALRRTQKYLSGESSPGMLDFMIWPFVERIPAAISFLSNSDADQYLEKELPTLWDYRNEMLKDSAVSKLATDVEILVEFGQSVRKRINDNKK